MGLWVFELFMAALIPIMMIVFGYIFLYKPPKTINAIYGYRTSMSMKNEETWAFAHHYCGRLWYICGWIMLVVTVAAMVAVIDRDEDTVGIVCTVVTVLQLIPMIGTIIPTERALKKNFDKDGRRR